MHKYFVVMCETNCEELKIRFYQV